MTRVRVLMKKVMRVRVNLRRSWGVIGSKSDKVGEDDVCLFCLI